MGYNCGGPILFVREVLVPELPLEHTADYGQIEFQDSVIGRLELTADVPHCHLPRFVRCHFGVIEGFTGHSDLPSGNFFDASVDAFENPAQTTNAILSLSLPLGTRVLLTVLKKLYAQRGSGRRETALFRGLDARAQQLVPPVIALLRREGFVTKTTQSGQTVWLPTKSSDARRRALSILASPSSSSEALLVQSRELD
jgi:hypothetical protein